MVARLYANYFKIGAFTKHNGAEKVWVYNGISGSLIHILEHGLRTPNEGINQRYLKNWADVADKICFGRT